PSCTRSTTPAYGPKTSPLATSRCYYPTDAAGTPRAPSGRVEQLAQLRVERGWRERLLDEGGARAVGLRLVDPPLAVAGHEQHPQPRAERAQLAAEVEAAHPGHDHIRDHDLDRIGIAAKEVKRVARARRSADGEAFVLEQLPDEPEQPVVVL